MVARSARGAAYEPEPPPQSGGVPALVNFLRKEFGRIASATRLGRSQFLSLDVLSELPGKPFDGMVAFFAAGVGPGGSAGLFEYWGGAWHKL